MTEADIAKLSEETELARGRLNAALSALRDVVSVIAKVGGYMSPEHQERYRHARGLLAEHGVVLRED